MSEYKFRGKGIASNEWYYGDLIIVNDTDKSRHYYIIADEYSDEDGNIPNTIKLDTCNSPEVMPETVGQYTYLKDKNGKEIYPGDILEYDTGARFVVVFEEMMIMCPKDKIELTSPGYFGILIGDKTRELCPLGNTQELCKVIGNTTNNPELLKEK